MDPTTVAQSLSGVMTTGLSGMIEPFFRLGEKLAEACLIFLTVTVAIRTLMMLVEVVLDEGASLASLFSRMARGAVLVSVLLVALKSWGSVQQGVIEGAYSAARVTTSVVSVNGLPSFDAGSNAEAVGQTVIRPVVEVVMGPIDRAALAAQVFARLEMIWLLKGKTPPPNANLVEWTQAEMADDAWWKVLLETPGIMQRIGAWILKAIVFGLVLVLLMVSCLFVGVMVLYHTLKAMLTILIAMALLPFGISIAPLTRDIAEKGVGAILGGIGQLCVVVFIGCLGINAANEMLIKMLDGTIPYSDMGMMASIQFVCLLTIVSGLLVPTAAAIATRLFEGITVGRAMSGTSMAVQAAGRTVSAVKSAIAAANGVPSPGGGGKPGGGGGKNLLDGYEPR